MPDAEQTESALREGREALAEHAGDPEVGVAWLAALAHGSRVTEGSDAGESILRALVDARLGLEGMPSDPDVVLALVHPIDDLARNDVERDVLVMQQLAAAARWVDLDADFDKVDHLRDLVIAEIDRSGVDAFQERLRYSAPERPGECGIGWNVVQAMTSAIASRATDDPAQQTALYQEVAGRWGAACLNGMPAIYEFRQWFAQIDPDARSTELIQEVIAEARDERPHVVAELDVAVANAPHATWRVPATHLRPGSAFVLRHARDDVAVAEGGSRSWSGVDRALDGLQQHGSMFDGWMLGETTAPDVLASVDDEVGLSVHLSKRYFGLELSSDAAAAVLRGDDLPSTSAPWALGRLISGSVEELGFEADVASRPRDGGVAPAVDAALDAFIAGLTTPSDEGVPAPPERAGDVDDLDEELHPPFGASRISFSGDADAGEVDPEPEQSRGPDDGSPDVGIDGP